MALDKSVLSELLDAFRTGEGLDLIKEAAALVCQELIEVELTAQIGADRYERTGTRSNERNGHRPRVLSTKAGDVELAIPKLRKGSFFPSILEPRRRIDQALYAVVMEAYVHGVSTRAVDELMAGLVLWFVAELHGDHRGLAERTAAGTQALWPFVVVITTRLVVRGATTLP
jgi:transposase-like protein